MRCELEPKRVKRLLVRLPPRQLIREAHQRLLHERTLLRHTLELSHRALNESALLRLTLQHDSCADSIVSHSIDRRNHLRFRDLARRQFGVEQNLGVFEACKRELLRAHLCSSPLELRLEMREERRCHRVPPPQISELRAHRLHARFTALLRCDRVLERMRLAQQRLVACERQVSRASPLRLQLSLQRSEASARRCNRARKAVLLSGGINECTQLLEVAVCIDKAPLVLELTLRRFRRLHLRLLRRGAQFCDGRARLERRRGGEQTVTVRPRLLSLELALQLALQLLAAQPLLLFERTPPLRLRERGAGRDDASADSAQR